MGIRKLSIGAAVLGASLLLVAFQNCAEDFTPPGEGEYGSHTSQGLTIKPVAVSPGAPATVVLKFIAPLSADLNVSYFTSDRTAIAGAHYTPATAGTATLAAGQTELSIQIPTINNATVDSIGREFLVTMNFGLDAFSSRSALVRFQNLTSVLGSYHLSSFNGSVTVGERHACAIKSGALYCWGLNSNGQLGNGTTTNSSVPVLVFESGVQSVAAGFRHTCAIRNGALFCWGLGTSHQLGTNTATDANSPRAVFNMEAGVQAVSAGLDHTCAMRSGIMYCWGGNSQAQVGHNSSSTQPIPFRVPGFESGVTAISASIHSTCAVRGDALFCWGLNSSGQLGLSSTTTTPTRNPSISTLTAVPGMESGVTAISGHGASVCGVRSGSLVCWGANTRSQVGNGASVDVTSPHLSTALLAPIQHVSTGQHHSCAVRFGYVYCWGSNGVGQLGDGTTTARTAPTNPVALNLTPGEYVETVAAGGMGSDANVFASTCARTSRGRVFCWGYNVSGQVGDGTVVNKPSPVEIALFSNP